MQKTNLYLFSFTLIFSLLISKQAPIQAASLIAVCSSNKLPKNCPKKRISFPVFAKDESGKAVFKYKIDQGELGELSSQETIDFTEEVLELWSNESNLSFEKEESGIFQTDITADNMGNFVDKKQGFNLIIWDADGAIIEKLLGGQAKNFVLGYATPIAFGKSKNKKVITSIKESQTLLNGFLFDRENIGGSREELINTFKTTVLHEFAHMFGIDHTQGGNLEGYNNEEGDFTDIPVMFPLAANPNVELHQDDIAVIKLAYPISSEVSSFGSISGSLTKSGEDVKGANIVAYKLEEDNPKLFSIASPADVDGLKQGNFLIPNLLPGSYALYAEPLDDSFQAGSSIGFHETPASFSPGFYNGETSFLNLSYQEGLSRAQVITVNAGDEIVANIDIDGNPGGSNDGSEEGGSFVAGGRLINGTSVLLKNKKNKKVALKLVNTNPGQSLNLRISTDYPSLINIPQNGLISFKKRSKKIKVRLASYVDFIQTEGFEELLDFSPVSVPLLIEDLDSDYSTTETLIVQ